MISQRAIESYLLMAFTWCLARGPPLNLFQSSKAQRIPGMKGKCNTRSITVTSPVIVSEQILVEDGLEKKPAFHAASSSRSALRKAAKTGNPA